jgi:hypothetical protein
MYTPEERARKVMKVDDEGKAYMHPAENIYRKIKTCKIPFSPKASMASASLLFSVTIPSRKDQESREP